MADVTSDVIFQLLCQCVKPELHSDGFLKLAKRASCIIAAGEMTDTWTLLMECMQQFFEVPDYMVDLKKKSHDYLMAGTIRLIDKCNELADELEKSHRVNVQ